LSNRLEEGGPFSSLARHRPAFTFGPVAAMSAFGIRSAVLGAMLNSPFDRLHLGSLQAERVIRSSNQRGPVSVRWLERDRVRRLAIETVKPPDFPVVPVRVAWSPQPPDS